MLNAVKMHFAIITIASACFLSNICCADAGVPTQIEQSLTLSQSVAFAHESNPLTNVNHSFLLPVQAAKSYDQNSIAEITFSEFKTLKEFINALATKENYAFSLMRMVAKEISFSSFKHFRLTFVPSSTGVKLVFSNASSIDDGINIYAPYSEQEASSFSKYLIPKYLTKDNQSEIFKNSTYTVSFPSHSGNLLVIPRGNYVNFYDFALKASSSEITDFWQHVLNIMNELNTDKFDLASHAGSLAGQTVFHFHLRFEFHDQNIKNQIKSRKTNP